MLVRQENDYQLAYVQQVKPKLILQPVKKTTAISRALPIGIVSREISTIQFTP